MLIMDADTRLYTVECLFCLAENLVKAEFLAKGQQPLCGGCKKPLVDITDMPELKIQAKQALEDIVVDPTEGSVPSCPPDAPPFPVGDLNPSDISDDDDDWA